MTSNRLSTSDIEIKRRIKGPYTIDDTIYLRKHVSLCLKKYREKTVNYEYLFAEIGNLPANIFDPEWQKYWNNWGIIISLVHTTRKREKIFQNAIEDALIKGIFPKDRESTKGLTGNFGQTILDIITKNPTL